MKTIAVVEDDIFTGNMLEEVLNREGYAVLRAYSGTEAVLLLGQKRPDLVLLDLMLPGLSGEEVLSKINGVPVIVVSAKADVGEKVKLLLNGAVDYITKPFDIKELLARITVAMRIGATNEPVLNFECISLDTAKHSVSVSNQPVKLTKTEYAILKLLMKNQNQVITKSVMLDEISIDTPDCMESSLKVHVSNLRKKLREKSGFDFVESVWGIGFRLKHSDSE